jgi:hypothetical protein
VSGELVRRGEAHTQSEDGILIGKATLATIVVSSSR